MIERSAPALVATCTAVLGLHSSSSTTSSYSYFAFGSALRSFTASSAELRAPMPLAAMPPVSGPMKATLALSLAAAGNDAKVKATAKPTDAAMADSPCFLIIFRFPSGGSARRTFARICMMLVDAELEGDGCPSGEGGQVQRIGVLAMPTGGRARKPSGAAPGLVGPWF